MHFNLAITDFPGFFTRFCAKMVPNTGLRRDADRSPICIYIRFLFTRPIVFARPHMKTLKRLNSLHNRRFTSQARRTRHFARSVRRGEEENKAPVTSPMWWLFPRLPHERCVHKLVTLEFGLNNTFSLFSFSPLWLDINLTLTEVILLLPH